MADFRLFPCGLGQTSDGTTGLGVVFLDYREFCLMIRAD